MPRQLSRSQFSLRTKVRVLGTCGMFVAALTLLFALASPAQQPARVSAAFNHLAASVTQEGRVSSSGHFTPATGNPVFLPPVTYAIGGGLSSSVAVADVNGDGKPDLIAVSGLGGQNGDGLVSVLLGNGDGTFQNARTFDSGGGFPTSVVVADLNRDGKPDLVVANCGAFLGQAFCPTTANGVLAIFLGNGDGTFQKPTLYDSGGVGAMQVAVADLNLDGKLDVLVANSGGGVAVFLGKGDGTVQPLPNLWAQSAVAMSVADVNADGRPDLLVLTGGSNNLEAVMDVLLGNGDGSFQPPVSYRVPGVLTAQGLAVADINQDGKLDVVAVGGNGNPRGKVGVLLGNGDGTFTQGASYYTGGRFVFSVAVTDVNGDGHPDLLAGNCTTTCVSEDGSVGVLVGAGHGFNPAALYDSGLSSARFVAVADLNGDGKPDLVVGHFFTNSLTVLLNQTVPFAYPTSTSLTSSINPSVYGQDITWTARVMKSGFSSVAPTGKIIFISGSNTIGTAILDSNSMATLARSNLNAGLSSLKAAYAGDASNLGSTSSVENQVVTQASTSATLTSSPNPSASGQAVTFTAAITSPTAKPTGPVTFAVGKTVLGTAQLVGGKAKFTTSALAAGSTSVTATYYGDSNIAKSSASVTQTVSSQGALTEEIGKLPRQVKTASSGGGCPSTTTLTSSGSPTVVGQETIFSASVYALALCNGIPQGVCFEQITFYDGNTAIGTAPLNINSCVATLTDTSLTARTHKIRARFPGSGSGDLPSNSNVITQVVTGDSTTTSLSSSLSPSIYGQSITWTAAVTSPDGFVSPPTGKVNLMWGGQIIDAATLNASGVATMTRSLQNANSYALTAVYAGDANNASSTSAVLNQVIQQATSSATLSSSANPSTLGQEVTFTTKITSPTVIASGPVTFMAGTTMLGTAQLKGGRAEFTTSTLAAGTTTVTATYSGDSNIAQSSASVTQTVQ